MRKSKYINTFVPKHKRLAVILTIKLIQIIVPERGIIRYLYCMYISFYCCYYYNTRIKCVLEILLVILQRARKKYGKMYTVDNFSI